MKALAEYIHELGLKAGLYSSPGPWTCGGCAGSYGHEQQDATAYAAWGFDYLKYDWCSYGGLTLGQAATDPKLPSVEWGKGTSDLSLAQKPYRQMGEFLRQQPRDIVYSLCQYGNREVWKWGAEVRGNSWRTGGDIEDTWKSTLEIIARQDEAAPYARSGHWNDPDMLVVGRVGWGGAPHPSRLTADEQYSHISLWSLLAAPLLLGNDLTQLDPFTRNLLTNDEVIAVDQDAAGHAARRVLNDDGWQVWVRELADGRKAVGIFNFGDGFRSLRLDAAALDLRSGAALRDLWRQKNLGPLTPGRAMRVPAHGVLLLAVSS
jgi:alpha-galactosidase